MILGFQPSTHTRTRPKVLCFSPLFPRASLSLTATARRRRPACLLQPPLGHAQLTLEHPQHRQGTQRNYIIMKWLGLEGTSKTQSLSCRQSCQLLRLNKPSSLSLSSQERCSSPLSIFVALLWTHSNSSSSFVCWGSHVWTQYFRWGLMKAEQREAVTSLTLLASPLSMQLRILLNLKE